MRDTPVEHSTAQLHLQALWLQLECQGNQGSQEVSAMLVKGLGKREGGRRPEGPIPRVGGRRSPVLEGLILGEYRKGRSCVDISISEGIPYSLVFETVKRNSTTANNIKV